jgi:hypothetical protein
VAARFEEKKRLGQPLRIEATLTQTVHVLSNARTTCVTSIQLQLPGFVYFGQGCGRGNRDPVRRHNLEPLFNPTTSFLIPDVKLESLSKVTERRGVGPV